MDEGRKVTVRCVASGATPAAEIYWNSEPEMDLSNVREDTKRSVPSWAQIRNFSAAMLFRGPPELFRL